jgi:hypothetical protein
MRDPVDFTRLHPLPSLWRRLLFTDLVADLSPPVVSYPEPPDPEDGRFNTGRGLDLAIDFGTSAIVAALVSSDFTMEVLNLNRRGGLLLDAPIARRWDFGNSALAENYELSSVPAFLEVGGTDPKPDWEYYPCLKRRIEWLARSQAGREWQTTAMRDVAAICHKALAGRGAMLRDRLLEPFQVYITVPNAFPRSAIDVLVRGVGFGVAATLGLREMPQVKALLEAEAVAYGAIAAPTLLPASHDRTVLVIDAGAGTTDASIVRSERGTLRVLAHVGLPVGGLDLDAHIAGCRGPLDKLAPFEVYRRVLTSRETKENHLRERDGVSPDQAFADLAAELQREYQWPAHSPRGAAMAGALRQGYERYLALAVDALIRSLPRDEIVKVGEVVVSGRGSLLTGFKDRVRREVARDGPDLEPRCAESDHGRKLAVVEGVGIYVASTYTAQPDRRPSRASFAIVLRHEGGRELELVPATNPLLEGWGVAAWHQPMSETGELNTRPAVDMRLIPRRVLLDLERQGSFSAPEIAQLLRWAIQPLLRLEKKAPYSARVAFDFLSLDARLQVDGNDVELPRHPRKSLRPHPVHQFSEDWFEIFHRRKA